MSTAAPAGRGRLFLVIGVAHPEVAAALARRFDQAAVVDVAVFDRMVVAGRASPEDEKDGRPTVEQVRQLLLRWSAAIATAETYQLECFDVVLTDALPGSRLEDVLDLVSPEPVHLVVVGGPDDPEVREIPPWGLWLDPAGLTTDEVVDAVLDRLDDAVVPTATDPGADD
ncbi:hypothetical protein N865_06665 [Intrasporangium oryzae NRRL B-24470]|uniref:Uncharacterized protein n=1 Tax=Intrasporangium oryzae NRRL B-24470 TaxID=1386089 RepID=W9G7Z2_9MICO|nr:hypothetical protein [Intrasporangium oryzae]EWT02316.1 hypothetical protein N865_06665 [Intrasporangium oryzae NRRL B-24470]